MKNLPLILVLFLAGISGCDDSDVVRSTPECVTEKIKQLEAAPATNPPMEIWRYKYKGKTVYFMPQYCCDFPSILWDENCNTICAPDGGFSGSGDGQCKDFFKERSDGDLIWKDKRAK